MSSQKLGLNLLNTIFQMWVKSRIIFNESCSYRVFHSKTIFLRWLKMTLKYIVHIKETYFYNHKDSPFDMKHQLMSADSLPVVKFDLSWKTIFHKFFFDFCRVNDLFAKLYFPLVSTWKSSTLSFMTCVGHILKFLESILMI